MTLPAIEMSLWHALLIALGGPSILLLALWWLLPTIIVHRLKKDLIEHETKFAHLYIKQAEVITKIYENFVKTEDAWTNLHINIAGDPSIRSERAREYLRSFEHMTIYFKLNRIWLPRKLSETLEPIVQKFIVADPEEIPRYSDYRSPDGSVDHLRYAEEVTSWSAFRITNARKEMEEIVWKFLEFKTL